MAHFALICPPFFSHVRVFEALGEELVARGHRATFLLNAGAEALVTSASVAATSASAAAGDRKLARVIRNAARPGGPLGILRTVADSAMLTDQLCREGPGILDALGVDAIIGDQMEPAAGLIAAYMRLPLVSLACALPVNRAPGIPMPFLGWPYDASEHGLERNRGGERVAQLLLGRQRRTIEGWSRRFGIPQRSTLEDCLSSQAQIAQLVDAFDFPRPQPAPFHGVGRICARAEAEAPLDLAIDPAKPFVFASLGTLQGDRLRLFKAVARACRDLGAQLLVAHCGKLSPRAAASIGATWVTDFAPQRAVLARADLCVTHAGLNTVLDALEAETPLLALPIAFDQPGVAARIEHHRVGKRMPRFLLTARKLRPMIDELLRNPAYREQAVRLGRASTAAGGVGRAADIVEHAVVGDRSA